MPSSNTRPTPLRLMFSPGQDKNPVVFDFVPAGAVHHRHTRMGFRARKVVREFALPVSDNLQSLGRQWCTNRRCVALQAFVRDKFFVLATIGIAPAQKPAPTSTIGIAPKT